MTDSLGAKELSAVREAHRFDEDALRRTLAAALGQDGDLTVQQFKGGQSNPTFLVSLGDQRLVLRKKPPGKLLPSAHAIEREHRVLSALQGSAVPVPRVRMLCEDASIIGTPFYVMDHVEGRLFRSPLMPEVTAPERRAICLAAVRTLAALHLIDPSDVGLQDFGKQGGYMARQVRRWADQYEASKTGEIADMDALIRWLPEHVPSHDETRIVHGDFRLENLIIAPEASEVRAVLDWELATLGHPLADLGYHLMLYHLPAGGFTGSGYVGANIEALGIPSQSELTLAYAEATGREPPAELDTFIAFGLFRLAAILQGVYRRGLDGNAASESALRFGPMVKVLAGIARGLTG